MLESPDRERMPVRRGWLPGPVGRRVVLALGLLILVAAVPRPGLTRQIILDGIVDCGRNSGQTCTVGPTLVLLSDDSGTRQPFTIDVSWILRQLGRVRQDERLIVEVEDGPDGILRAIRVIDHDKIDGTDNRGASAGSRTVSEQPKKIEKDDANNQPPWVDSTPTPSPTATSMASATPTGTPTGSPTTTATSTPTPTATSTPTFTATSTGTVTPTATSPVPTDLAAVKTGPATVISGFTITYTVTVTNIGPSDGSNLVLVDDFSGSAVTFDSVVPPSGWTCVPPILFGTRLTCTAASLASGQSAVFTIRLDTDPSDTPPGTIISNTATISGGPGPDPAPGNNSDTVTTTAVGP